MSDGNYTPMRVGAIEIIGVNFGTLTTLRPDETLVSASWEMGTDTGLVKIGAASIDGFKVSQQLEAVEPGWYYPKCWAVTSLGNRLDLPDPGKGALRVVE